MPVVLDTNILIDYPRVLDEFKDIVIPITVLEELDRKKVDRDKDKAWKARRAINRLEVSNVRYDLNCYTMPCNFEDKADNKIIMCAQVNNATLISNDIAVRIKAESLGIPVQRYTSEYYNGVYNLTGTTQDILDFYSGGGYKELVENQYLIITNTDTGDSTELVMKKGSLVPLKLPKEVKGWNQYQRCALDLLYNEDIPIKIICGVAGSGKTCLTIRMAVEMVLANTYEKLVMVRNPIGAGEDIGFLPGNVEEKTGAFYRPIIENIDGGVEVVKFLEERKKLEKNIPFLMKGITIKNSFCIIDEAEDLNLKTLELIGSRIGDGSVFTFCGDYAQAESKFINDNGLVKFIDTHKGNPLVGIVVLENNVRSSASKLFTRI